MPSFDDGRKRKFNFQDFHILKEFVVSRTYVGDTDLGLGELEALLDDAEQGGGRHERAVDVRLTYVTLDAEHVCRVHEARLLQVAIDQVVDLIACEAHGR